MIDIKELRIGNIINVRLFFPLDPDIYRKQRVGVSTFKRIWVTKHPEKYQPIPLTPEILLKCGFNNTKTYINFSSKGVETTSKIEGIHYFEKTAYIVHKIDNEFILHRILNVYDGWEVGTTFKYLHQLQNLYFALTGEELNIQL